jgi:hypothetical protein
MAGKFGILAGEGAKPMFSFDAAGKRSLVDGVTAIAKTGEVFQNGTLNNDLKFDSGNSSVYSNLLSSTISPYGMSLMSALPPGATGEDSVRMLASMPGATGSGTTGVESANAASNAQRVAFVNQADQAERARVQEYVAQQNSQYIARNAVEGAAAERMQSLQSPARAREITPDISNASYAALQSMPSADKPMTVNPVSGGTYAYEATPVVMANSGGKEPVLENVASLDNFPKPQAREMAKLAADPARVAAISSVAMVAPAAAAAVQQVKHVPAPAYARVAHTSQESHSAAALPSNAAQAMVQTAQHRPASHLAKPATTVARTSAMPPSVIAYSSNAAADDNAPPAMHKQHARTVQDVASMNMMPLPPRANFAEPSAIPMPTSVEQVVLAKPSVPANAIGLNMFPATSHVAETAASHEPVRVVNKLKDVALFASHAREARIADEGPNTSWLPETTQSRGIELSRSSVPQPVSAPQGVSEDAKMAEVAAHFENTIQNLTSSGASYEVVQSVVDNYRDFMRYRNSQNKSMQAANANANAWSSVNA